MTDPNCFESYMDVDTGDIAVVNNTGCGGTIFRIKKGD